MQAHLPELIKITALIIYKRGYKNLINILHILKLVKHLEEETLTKLKYSVKIKDNYIPMIYPNLFLSKNVFPNKRLASDDSKSEHMFFKKKKGQYVLGKKSKLRSPCTSLPFS